MYLLIPVDSDNGYDAKITSMLDVKKWAIVDFDAGKGQSIQFVDDWRESDIDWFDFVILNNKFESYIDFMNEGMMCLCIRKEETIEEIISAFAFKELDEVGL
jgi:hypothetical protein